MKTHPPSMEMITEAIKNLRGTSDGVLASEIKSYIINKYPSVKEEWLHIMVRNTIQKGLKNCLLSRPRVGNQIEKIN